MSTWTDADSRALTVELVVEDGHNLPLRGEERAAAIRAMVARGLDIQTIATRLCVDDLETLRAFARRWQIDLPPTQPPQPWWVEVACPSDSKAGRARQPHAQRARTAARSHA